MENDPGMSWKILKEKVSEPYEYALNSTHSDVCRRTGLCYNHVIGLRCQITPQNENFIFFVIHEEGSQTSLTGLYHQVTFGYLNS